MTNLRLLELDGIGNVLLGLPLLLFPELVSEFLGLPTIGANFYPAILGAVFVGIWGGAIVGEVQTVSWWSRAWRRDEHQSDLRRSARWMASSVGDGPLASGDARVVTTSCDSRWDQRGRGILIIAAEERLTSVRLTSRSRLPAC